MLMSLMALKEKLPRFYIDGKLSFDHNISKFCQKASNKLSAFASLSPYMNQSELRILTRALLSVIFNTIR